MDDVTAFAEIIVKIDDLVGGHRVGDTLYIDVLAFLTADVVLDLCVGLVGDKDLTRRSHLLKPAREIYTAADDGVIHPILTAKIPDRTETCVDAGPTPWRFFYPHRAPGAIKFEHSLAHSDCHPYAGESVCFNALGLWIAEENEDRVTNVLVDRPTKLKSDLRHLGQIMVEELCQVLRFEPFSRLRETFEV